MAGVGLGAQYYLEGHMSFIAGIRIKGVAYQSWADQAGPFSSLEKGTYKGVDLSANLMLLRLSVVALSSRAHTAAWFVSGGFGL
jgi:hypothetical protein